MYTIMHEPGEDVAICFKHDSCTDVIMLDQAMGMAFRLGLTFHDLESMLDALDKALPELDARAKDDSKKGKCLGDVEHGDGRAFAKAIVDGWRRAGL